MSSILLFGRSYEQVGSTNSDYLIKTRGSVKIQWGGKFIDLIKDGKINVDAKFIFKESEVGTKDGIYLVDDNVWLVVGGGEPINLKGEIGNTYVSFAAPQETESDQKYQALVNIGFLYKDLSEITSDSLLNGIVYIENELKLYIIKDGNAEPYSFEFPNPFTEQFIILKDDGNKGSLLIKGSGVSNSIAFDGFYIYSESNNAIINSTSEISLLISDKEVANIGYNKSVFKNTILSNNVYSIGASSNTGFRLYTLGGESTLEVDNLIVRNPSTDDLYFYPEYWLGHNILVLKSDEDVGDDEDSDELDDEEVPDDDDGTLDDTTEETALQGEQAYVLKLLQGDESLLVGDILVGYIIDEGEDENDNELEDNEEVPDDDESSEDSTDEDDSLDDDSTEDGNDEGNTNPDSTNDDDEDDQEYSFTETFSKVFFRIDKLKYGSIEVTCNQPIESINILFKIKQEDDSFYPIRIRDNNIEVVKYSLVGENWYELEEEILLTIGLEGICAMLALYAEGYELPADDNSTKFASTEWVLNLLGPSGGIPKGAIIMYNGEEPIPDGWAVCDGTNGTPDLNDKFIRGSIAVNFSGSINIMEDEESETKLDYYSVIFIMKIV